MKPDAIQDPLTFTLGYYVVAEVNGHKLFCSRTLFKQKEQAEFWRRRWQEKLPAHTVTIEPEIFKDEIVR